MSRYAQTIGQQRQQAGLVIQRKVAPGLPTLSATGTRTAHLQRAVGNQALGRLAIQAKLTLGPVNDPYEREADAVAKQVVQQMRTPTSGGGETPAVQRQGGNSAEELDENALTRKPTADFLQRMGGATEDEELPTPVMAKSLVQCSATDEPGNVDPAIEASIQRARGNGQPLGDGVRAPLESAFGADFSRVNIHTSGEADALNQSLQARAFTTGQDIFFRQGEYNPGSAAGQELLAHELTHVVQQNGDTVKKSVTPVQRRTPIAIRPYRDKDAFNFGKRDTKLLKEEPYRGLATQPLIEQITVKLDGIAKDAQDGYLMATGTLEATYKSNKAAWPKITLKITAGSKQLGLTKHGTSTSVRRIEGFGYNDQPLPSTEGEGPKKKYARSGSASMHYAVFFYGGEAIHVGSVERSSHGCIHVGNDEAGFAIAQQINYHAAVGKTKVDVRYEPTVLKMLKAQNV